MDSLGHLAQGFVVAAKPINLLVAFLGSFIGTFLLFFSSESRHELTRVPGSICSKVSETITFVVWLSATMYRRPSGLVSTLLTTNPGKSRTTPQSFDGKESRPCKGFGS